MLPNFPPVFKGITNHGSYVANHQDAIEAIEIAASGCPRRVGAADDDDIEIRGGWEESKTWDTEWWRRLLCGDYNLERPKYLPGDVFKLGSMRESWHGKEYVGTPCMFLLPAAPCLTLSAGPTRKFICPLPSTPKRSLPRYTCRSAFFSCTALWTFHITITFVISFNFSYLQLSIQYHCIFWSLNSLVPLC